MNNTSRYLLALSLKILITEKYKSEINKQLRYMKNVLLKLVLKDNRLK